MLAHNVFDGWNWTYWLEVFTAILAAMVAWVLLHKVL